MHLFGWQYLLVNHVVGVSGRPGSKRFETVVAEACLE
jgi:hypothetical protein